jgi:hypothetical protein
MSAPSGFRLIENWVVSGFFRRLASGCLRGQFTSFAIACGEPATGVHLSHRLRKKEALPERSASLKTERRKDG